jgi:hypothetical protein
MVNNADLTFICYSKRKDLACTKENLIKLIHTEVDYEISDIPPLWIDLFYDILISEQNNLFNRPVQDDIYKKLNNLYSLNPEGFSEGIVRGLEYWFQGIRSYIGLADIIRDIGQIDRIPEIKTRLYRIPLYSQILESILSNLFRFIREILGNTKDVDYSKQNGLNNLKEILVANGFDFIFHHVDVDVRNAINHGGIIINPGQVKFIYTFGKNNIKQEKDWAIRDIWGEVALAQLGIKMPHFDDFIEGAFDDAGGIIIGFLRFLCKHPEIIIKNFHKISEDWYLLTEYMCRFLSYPGAKCTHIDTGLVYSQLNMHFLVTESDHGKLAHHAFEAAIMARSCFHNYKNYTVSYRHSRMPPGIIVFNKEELDKTINNEITPEKVMTELIARGDFRLLSRASDEDIDLDAVKRFKYPLIGIDEWILREIEDCSLENLKRFRANLYVPNINNKCNLVRVIRSAIEQLKYIENPPSPICKIKHGRVPADAVYLHVFIKRLRRRARFISPDNSNFICLVEWHSKICPPLKEGGIPSEIWEKLEITEDKDLLISWNPSFSQSAETE